MASKWGPASLRAPILRPVRRFRLHMHRADIRGLSLRLDLASSHHCIRTGSCLQRSCRCRSGYETPELLPMDACAGDRQHCLFKRLLAQACAMRLLLHRHRSVLLQPSQAAFASSLKKPFPGVTSAPWPRSRSGLRRSGRIPAREGGMPSAA